MKQQDLFSALPPVAPKPAPAAVVVEKPVPVSAPPPAPAWKREPAKQVWSVGELTLRIKDALEPNMRRIWVKGEVSGYRGPNVRGHLYFSIKDEYATIEVRIWQSTARALKFALKDGLSLVIEGAINVYEPQGRYALIAEKIEPTGVGAQALAFEQLKAKLMAEGLFGDKRTRPRRALPLLPKRVGVVTSISGAALRDFLKVAQRRHPGVSILVCDARVQGDDAAIEVARGIRVMGRQRIDVLVVTRGGGSADDLWTFNEERVARAIFDCPVPVVSAVGHEIDITMADLVADLRAPTPSAAAELVTPVYDELVSQLAMARTRLRRAMERRVLSVRNGLSALRGRLGDPRRRMSSGRLHLNALAERSARAVRRRLKSQETRVDQLAQRLQTARPQAQLARWRTSLREADGALKSKLARRLKAEHERLKRLGLQLRRRAPQSRIVEARRSLMHLQQRLERAMGNALARSRSRQLGAAAKLDSLSPLAVLGRGYAIALGADGHVLRRAGQASVGQPVVVRLGQGRLEATVSKVEE